MIYILIIDWKITAAYFAAVILSVGIQLIISRIMNRTGEGIKRCEAALNGKLANVLKNRIIVKLIAGLYLPDGGRITADGCPVNEENVTAWRRRIAYMPQDIFIFDADVKANIALDIRGQDMDKVKRAAADAGIADAIEAADSGYETKLSGKESGFSGGELQRISLARTLYQDRDILIIDEPTSALDPETEETLKQKLEGIPKEKTVIAVTHRLNITENFDRIYMVKDGRVTGYVD